MPQRKTIFIVSDIHYACPAEQLRHGHEARAIGNPILRLAVKLFRHYIWLREPMKKNHLLDQFIERIGRGPTKEDGNEQKHANRVWPDFVIANGDYSCDSAFLGVCDDAAFESAQECLNKLRTNFPNFHAVFGDHELGKLSFFGGRGGMRVASFHRAEKELGIAPFWQMEIGTYVLIGVTSSLIALPVFQSDTLPEEYETWSRLREIHVAKICEAFGSLKADQKVILFCHDPSALPFLWELEPVRDKLSQVEQTIIGHLHSPAILWKSRRLAGIPAINFLGNTAKRLSKALRRARHWRHFNVRLCPSLAGIELLKDGGYLSMELDPEGKEPARFEQHRIHR